MGSYVCIAALELRQRRRRGPRGGLSVGAQSYLGQHAGCKILRIPDASSFSSDLTYNVARLAAKSVTRILVRSFSFVEPCLADRRQSVEVWEMNNDYRSV